MQYKVIISICSCFAWSSIGESYKIPLDSQLQGFLLYFYYDDQPAEYVAMYLL